MPLSVGTRLGPYEILAAIGAGGMGEVYRARDTKLDREVAIKVLPAALAQDPERLARFEREAKVLASLNHKNIATIYAIEESPAGKAIAMELVPGQTLKGPLPVETALNYARQIAEALEAAHEKGITHRDLKPANIMITPEGEVKVLDFGLASVPSREVGSDPANSPTLTLAATQAGMILGTAAYMSPEQARGIPADKRADIWSFGVVLYEILAGRRLFEGKTVSDTLAAVLKTDPDWSTLPKDTPTPIRRLLRRCLERERKRRLPDIGVARLEIDEAQAEPEGPPGPVNPDRRWWLAVASGLALAVGGGWALSHLLAPRIETRVLRVETDPPEGGQFVFGLGLIQGGISISPDGRTAAYVVSSGGKIGLWVRSLESGSARLLSGTEGASYPFWSPDSRFLAYFTEGALQRFDLRDGTPFKICDLTAASISGGAWSDDGSILIGGVNQPLLRVSASGGTPAPLLTAPGYNAAYPQALPGGRFLYFETGRNQEETGVYAASIAKPAERTRLLVTDTNAIYAAGGDGESYLLFLRGSTLFAQVFDPLALQLRGKPFPLADPVDRLLSSHRMNVAASETGIVLYSASQNLSQFRWIDRTGRTLGIVGERAEFTSFRLSPDGWRAAAIRSLPGGGDIRVFDLDRGVDNRLTSRLAAYAYPLWSPDGKKLVFSSGRPPRMFERSLSGAVEENRVTQSEKVVFELANDWSPDGRYILFFGALPDTYEDLWYVEVSPETGAVRTAPQPYLRTSSHELNGRFSPEMNSTQRWVTYQSDESGRYEIYADLFPEPSRKIQVSTGGGQFPEWGPPSGTNGRELFYVSPDYKLMAVTLRFGAGSVEASAPRALFSLPVAVSTWTPFQATPDGQRFLVRAVPEQVAPHAVRAIVNWPELAKKAFAP